MVAACAPHHDAIHAGTWTITMINGIPYATPPPWLDPTRTPRRNTLPHDEATTITLAHQLTLDLDVPHVGVPHLDDSGVDETGVDDSGDDAPAPARPGAERRPDEESPP